MTAAAPTLIAARRIPNVELDDAPLLHLGESLARGARGCRRPSKATSRFCPRDVCGSRARRGASGRRLPGTDARYPSKVLTAVGPAQPIWLSGRQTKGTGDTSSASAVNWLMRKTVNSAAFIGAIPTSTTTLPVSRESAGLVSASHLT